MSGALDLRPYQQDAIRAVAAAYKRGLRRVAVVLPTGTGKTIVFANIVRGTVEKHNRALILAHRDELIQQAHDKLLAVAPDLWPHVGVVQGDRDEFDKPVVIASVQTLTRERRIQRLLSAGIRFDVVIVDECHHAPADSYQRILHAFAGLPDDPEATPPDPDAPLLLGFTATARREDDRSLGDTFEEVSYYRDMPSMIREGYLCDLRGIQIKLDQRFDASKLHTRGGDYIDSEAAAALIDAEAPLHTVGAWQRHAAGRKTIVFTPTIALAELMAETFLEDGVAAECVSGVPMDERRRVLERFRTGTTTVVTNAAVLTEGFDAPDVACIVIARPTKSQILFCQMVGRGTRVALGKTDCLILDMASVTDRLDLITLPRMLAMESPQSVSEDDEAVVSESFIEQQMRMAEEGRIVARQVELFNRQSLAWQHIRPGLWALALASQNVTLEQHPADPAWDVHVYGRDSHRILASDLSQGLAMGAAEDYARQSGTSKGLLDKTATWRRYPATLAQAETLRRWRQTIPSCPACGATGGDRIGLCRRCNGEGSDDDGRNCRRCAGDGREPGNCRVCHGSGTSLTKGEASDLMNQHQLRRQRRKAAR